MKLSHILIVIQLLFFSSNAYARLLTRIALINDPNGFVLVKSKPNPNSETIYRLNNLEVFEIDMDYIELDSTWIKIWIDENLLPMQGEAVCTSGYGFIERSKILLVDSLAICTNSDVLLSFNIVKADTNKIVDDSLMTHGLDIPLSWSYMVNQLQLISGGKTIKQASKFYSDLYNVTFQEGIYNSSGDRFSTYLKDNTYYIRQDCSDGSGFYWIVWVIKDNEIIQRLAVDLT